MKLKLIFLIKFFVCLISQSCAQKSPTEEAKPIVAEAKLMYKSEMASWYGTDLFIQQYEKRENIGGYFSYTENEISKCVFYSKTTPPLVIGTISFDKTFDITKATVELAERKLTNKENDFYTIRQLALNEIESDTMFKSYANTNFNLIPLISENEKKVYVLTGPKKLGIVIFGNDYLITFNKDNKLISKRQLHKNIIPVNYGEKDQHGNENIGAIHSHLPETGDFMTATDICTLMLYARFAKWKQHTVVSEKYLNIWNCETEELLVLPLDEAKKIQEDIEKKTEK